MKICESIVNAIDCCAGYDKIFICGGESVYRQALPLANKIDLTIIPGQYEGDAFFPEIDNGWTETDTVNFEDFSVITYNKTHKEKI